MNGVKCFFVLQIIDLYFDGNRKGDSAVKWFNKHCEGKIDSKKGKPFVMLTEISKMDEVIGSMFTKRPHRPFGFAFLIKLAGKSLFII